MVKRKSNVLAIVSPKGGVGKTVTTANLAVALAIIFDKKVLAVDTNVSTASLGLHFDIFYPKHTIHDALEKNPIEKSIHVYHQNLHLIPASIKIRKKEKSLEKVRENFHKAISKYEKLIEKVSKKYDIVLLDCSPGFDLETIAAMHIAGGMIVVSNPDYPSIITAARVIEYAQNIKMPVGGIVLNKVRKKKYELKKDEIENALNVKVLEEIPFDKRVPESIAKKIPIILLKSSSKSSKAYKRLAASLVGYKKDNFLSKVRNMFTKKR